MFLNIGSRGIVNLLIKYFSISAFFLNSPEYPIEILFKRIPVYIPAFT